MAKPAWTLGTSLSNWTLHHITSIPELGSLTAFQFLHHPSRALLLYCHRDDPLQTFSISFKTPVKDSKGTPHILEHVTLCGSGRYPVRDPFFRMLNRSLAAYMNAWTASDHTTYPFVTENLKDYEHLREVYWDAVFNPLLRVDDFRQEGWRVEKEEGGGRKLAGVVFNEMKGALSDADSIFGTRLNKYMLHGTEYAHISGGDPLHIPRLTHRDLVQFHRKHYRPSNALIVMHGDKAPDFEVLDRKISEVKGASEAAEPEALPELAPLTSSPWFVTAGPSEPLGDPLRQTRFIKSFLVGKADDLQRNFNFSMLSHLLLDGPSSPMYQALMESGLGRAYAPGTGFDSHARYATFSVGVQGMLEGDARRVSQVIDEVLLRTSMEGFPSSRVDAALEAIELSLKHQPALLGLGLVSKAAAHWTRSHGGSIAECLKIQERLDAFRRDTTVLKQLAQQHLLPSNKQGISLTQLVNPDYFARRAEQEEAVLASIAEDSHSVQAATPLDDSSILPTLSVTDIRHEIRDKSIKGQGNLFYRHTELSNGITHVRALLPISTDKLHLVPILCEAMTEMGVEGMSAAEYSEAVKRHTGGISVSPLLTHDGRLFVHVSSYSLTSKFNQMLELVVKAVKTAKWGDGGRLKTVMQQLASSVNGSIADSGHAYAKCRAASTFSPVQVANELVNGLSFVERLNQITDRDHPQLANDLQSLASSLDSLNNVCIISDHPNLDPSALTLQFGKESRENSIAVTNGKELESDIQMPFDTNFVAAVRQVNTSDSSEIASLLLLARILRSKYLHPRIREEGGAYGADASFNSLTSLFSMASYRDPSPDRTAGIFSDLSKLNVTGMIDEESVREAKLAHFSSTDAPKEIGDQGLSEFMYGHGDERRQEIRSAVLTCDMKGIKDALDMLRGSQPKLCTIRKSGKAVPE